MNVLTFGDDSGSEKVEEKKMIGDMGSSGV